MGVGDRILGVLVRWMALGTPLLWGALGEIYAERAGVVNLGVEGMMILGAFFAFAAAQLSGHPGLGLLVAAVIGGMAALLHAFVSVTLRANHFVSGLALPMLGWGLRGGMGRGWDTVPRTQPPRRRSVRHAVASRVSPPGVDPTGALADDAICLHDPGPGDSGALGRPCLAGAGGTGAALPPRRTIRQCERPSCRVGLWQGEVSDRSEL